MSDVPNALTESGATRPTASDNDTLEDPESEVTLVDNINCRISQKKLHVLANIGKGQKASKIAYFLCGELFTHETLASSSCTGSAGLK